MPTPTATPTAEPAIDPPTVPEEDIAAAVHALGPEVLWVADVVPLLRRDEETPALRHAFVLVMADTVRLVADLVSGTCADDAAALLVSKIREAIAIAGTAPGTLIIRGQQLAREVQRALPDVPVEGVDTLSDIDGPEGDSFTAAALQLRHAMDGDMIPNAPAAAAPHWSAWRLSDQDIARFFAAAAALYRAATQCGFTGDGEGTAFLLDAPGEREALITLSGADPSGNHPVSATVYAEVEDWDAMVKSARDDPRAADVRHPIMSLRYVGAEALDRGAIAEMRARGWEIAEPAAYPWAWFLNAIGGGVTTTYLRTLTNQLNALARALATVTVPIDIDLTVRYIDRETGIGLRSIAA